MEAIWVPISMFIALAIVLSLWLYFRSRDRSALQQTVQLAIEKGQELSPEVLDRLGQPKVSGHADLRRGVIAISLAIAFALFAVIIDEADAERPMLAVAAFPFLIGVAYILLWRFAGDKDR